MRAAEDGGDEGDPGAAGGGRVVLQLVHDDAVAIGRQGHGAGDRRECRPRAVALQQVVLQPQVGGEPDGDVRPGGVEEGVGALFEGVPHACPHDGRVREQPLREGLLQGAPGLGQVHGPLARRRVGER